MTSPLISKAIPLTQISYAAASITASYTLAGSFTSPAEMMYILSTLDDSVQVSFDGINDHISVPKGSDKFVLIPINFKTNNTALPNPSIYVKRIGTPTTGGLNVSAFSAAIP